MVDVTTLDDIVLPVTANETVLDPPASRNHRQRRRQRLPQLREAIESGEYCVAASDVADAILRSGQHAN